MLPLSIDRPQRHTPVVTYALVVSNVLVALLMSMRGGSPFRDPTALSGIVELIDVHAKLYPQVYRIRLESGGAAIVSPEWWQFITYQFLHGGIWHLLGNMVFLWVFGPAIEDRLGRLGYLLFFLTGGIVAGLGHGLTSDAPVIGASGSISAITGLFLAMFPRTRVRLLWIFLLITIVEIPSLWFIGASFLLDVFRQIGAGPGHVAYMAHIAGSVFGFTLGMTLLFTRLSPREPYDLMSLITHWRRRQQFRSLTDRGFDPWRGSTPDRPKPKKPAKADKPAAKVEKPAPTPPIDERARRISDLRNDIASALVEHDLDHAARLYRDLLNEEPTATLSQDRQLDVANHLFAQSEYELAARAYQLLLDRYPTADSNGRVRLMLGVTLARYLDRANDARPILEAAVQRLTADSDRELAQAILAEIDG